jgi:putative endonuclease
MLKSIDRLKNKTYVGYTTDIQRRLFQHNNKKGAKSTRGFKWVVIYKKRFSTKSKALSYEFKLKKDKKKRSEILKNNEDKT